MTEDDAFINSVLAHLRRRTDNKTEQAENLASMLEHDTRLRGAVARQLVARQVPMKGAVG